MMETGYENGKLVGVEDFDYGDRGNPLSAELTEASEEYKNSESTTLGKIFGLLLTYGGTNSNQFFITANVLSFVLGLHPNQGAGGVVIAQGLGMEKQTWFRRVNQMRNILKSRGAILPRIAGEWTKIARETIKQATTKHHDRRKSNYKSGHIETTKRFSDWIKETGTRN